MNVIQPSDETDHTVLSSVSLGKRRGHAYSAEGFPSSEKFIEGDQGGDVSPRRRKSKLENNGNDLIRENMLASTKHKIIPEEAEQMERLNFLEGAIQKRMASTIFTAGAINQGINSFPEISNPELVKKPFENQRNPLASLPNNYGNFGMNRPEEDNNKIFIDFFDAKRDFEVYFPHNNPEVVISYFKDKLRKKIRNQKKLNSVERICYNGKHITNFKP